MDVYNLSYDEFKNKIVQAWRKNFPDDHASLKFTREMVIVENTNKNPNSIAKDNLDFTGEERSNTQYLTIKNKKLV